MCTAEGATLITQINNGLLAYHHPISGPVIFSHNPLQLLERLAIGDRYHRNPNQTQF
jgi:hypothetical protein